MLSILIRTQWLVSTWQKCFIARNADSISKRLVWSWLCANVQTPLNTTPPNRAPQPLREASLNTTLQKDHHWKACILSSPSSSTAIIDSIMPNSCRTIEKRTLHAQLKLSEALVKVVWPKTEQILSPRKNYWLWDNRVTKLVIAVLLLAVWWSAPETNCPDKIRTQTPVSQRGASPASTHLVKVSSGGILIQRYSSFDKPCMSKPMSIIIISMVTASSRCSWLVLSEGSGPLTSFMLSAQLPEGTSTAEDLACLV